MGSMPAGNRAPDRLRLGALLSGAVLLALAGCGGGSAVPPAGKAWGTAQPIDNLAARFESTPQIAFNAAGDAIVAWRTTSSPTGFFTMQAVRFIPGVGWGPPQQISSATAAGDTARIRLAADGHGNITAVWYQEDGTADTPGTRNSNIIATRFSSSGGTWETPFRIDDSTTGRTVHPRIAADGDGNVVAVWSQWDNVANTSNVVATRYLANAGWPAGWLPPTRLNTESTGSFPQVAVAPGGSAVAVWTQNEADANFHLYASRFDNVSWSTGHRIEPLEATDSSNPKVGLSPNGDAIVAWQKRHIGDNVIALWAVRNTAGAWGPEERVSTDNAGDANGNFPPSIVVDADGDAIVAWIQSDGFHDHVWARRFSRVAGWEAARRIDSDLLDAFEVQLSVDPSGNAIAVWTQGDGLTNHVWANRYVANSGWGIAIRVEADVSNMAARPDIAQDRSGNAIAVWDLTDPTGIDRRIRVNRYE